MAASCVSALNARGKNYLLQIIQRILQASRKAIFIVNLEGVNPVVRHAFIPCEYLLRQVALPLVMSTLRG
jgi:hypothetical protein